MSGLVNQTQLYPSTRYKSHYGTHSKLEAVSMFAFIISLGLGEVISIGPIKLAYISTLWYLIVSLNRNNWRLKVSLRDPYCNKLLHFFFIWISYSIVQLLWIKDFGLYLIFFRIQIINFLIIYFIIVYIRDWADWWLVAKAFCILILISLLVGQWEILTGNHLVDLVLEENLIYYSHRAVAFYGNGNDYATVLVEGTYILLICLCMTKQIRTKVFLLLLIIGATIQIINIDARGASYSLILMMLVILILYITEKATKGYKKRTIIANYILIFATAILFLLIFSRFSPEELIGQFSGAGNYRSDLGRLIMIVNGFKALLKTVGFGTGPGQSILANNINLHFFYLEILVEWGVFIGGYLIWLFFSLFFLSKHNLSSLVNAIIRSFPITIILLGVSSSGMIRLRATWISFALVYLLAYKEFDKKFI